MEGCKIFVKGMTKLRLEYLSLGVYFLYPVTIAHGFGTDGKITPQVGKIFVGCHAKKVPNVLSRCHTKRRTGAQLWYDTDFLVTIPCTPCSHMQISLICIIAIQ